LESWERRLFADAKGMVATLQESCLWSEQLPGSEKARRVLLFPTPLQI